MRFGLFLGARNKCATKEWWTLDKAVMEVYVNGRACYSRMLESYHENDIGIEVFTEDGSATVKSIEAWEMTSIWK